MSVTENQNPGKDSSETKSDAAKLAQEHLEDQNHVITEEDMRNIKVGSTPGPDAPTQEAIENAEDHIADRKPIDSDDAVPGGQKVTPWDTIK